MDISSSSMKQERLQCQGMFYKRMKVDKFVHYDSDLSRFPKDTVVIKALYKYSYEQVNYT